jgi:hypothetical protein
MTEKEPNPSFPAVEVVKVLLANQLENDLFIRHYEDVRYKITQITVTLAGLLIGASRFGPQLGTHASNLPISLFIITLGSIGIAISAKYSERADRHATLARSYRRAASKLIGDFQGTDAETIHDTATSQHAISNTSTRVLAGLRARYFWYAVHICVILLGILVAFV